MKRGLKRALSLALAMLFACFSTVCSAAADVLPFIPFDEAAVSLSVRSEAQTVSRGESFTVEIFVTKNTGFHRLALRRDLGNGLSTTGEVVPGTVTDGETDDLLFVHDDGDTVATGLLASVTVLVGEKAPAGPVTVSFAVDECTDMNGRAVPAEVGSLSVTVAIPVSTITLNETAGALSAGQTVVLTASALPDASHATFTWSSSDPTVASVAAKAGDPLSATVTALKPGTAEIRVTAD
ncbi:MAG: Ig domain-containing protein, partial [Clostridia bacterium]|nr:Ig domain-containing protein [Clostridia bacterium]